jgi:phage/plasmid primase-like uncharacterized protein
MAVAFPSLVELAAALGGKVSGRQVLAPGPGHKPSDRSMAVRPEVNAEDGFVVYSHSNDDWRACRDHVRERLGLPNWNGHAAEAKTLTAADVAARAEAARLDEAARIERQAKAAHEASTALKKAKKAKPDCAHPYLAKKKIQPSGAHVTDDGKLLVVPMRDIDGTLHNVQCISANGEKRFVFGGRVTGCFYAMGKKPSGTDIIYVTEGFATGATVSECMGGAAVAVAFNCGNLAAVATALRSKFPAAQLVLCADDDAGTDGNPGLTKAREAASAVQGLVAVPEFGADRPDGATDFNDMHRRGGAVRACIEATTQIFRNGQDKTASGAAAGTQPAPLIRAAALDFALFDALGIVSRKKWLVDRLLGLGEASSFYGEPGSGKSVLAEDLGLRVAAGRDWHGRAVKQGAVLFLALERAALVKRRAVAFGLHTGLSGLPFAVASGELDFRDIRTADAIAATAAAVRDETRNEVVLIIVDTISRALCGGDENSPKDMGALVRTIGRTISLTGAHLLGVHHSPVDGGNRQRGHSSLKGALDVTMHVAKSGSMRTATATKANDAEEGQAIGFTLESVDIDRDEDGNVTTAPIVVAAQRDTEARPPTRKLSDRQKLALEALSNCVADRGKPPPASFAVPADISAISVADWRDELISTGIIDRDGPNPREAFRQLMTGLKGRHLIAEREDLIWRCR